MLDILILELIKYSFVFSFLISYLTFDSWKNDTNVILADEMGLGKTVQSVSMVGFLQVDHIEKKPVFLSLKINNF